MDLTPTSTTYAATENRSWLGSAHATDTCDSVTLRSASFTGTWADGNVPSGVVLGKITATGLYAPYVDGNSDGTEVARGILYTSTKVSGTNPVGAPMLWHGQVIEAKLPTSHGLDANGKTDLKFIQFV